MNSKKLRTCYFGLGRELTSKINNKKRGKRIRRIRNYFAELGYNVAMKNHTTSIEEYEISTTNQDQKPQLKTETITTLN